MGNLINILSFKLEFKKNFPNFICFNYLNFTVTIILYKIISESWCSWNLSIKAGMLNKFEKGKLLMFTKVIKLLLIIMLSAVSFKAVSVLADSNILKMESVSSNKNSITIDWTTENLNYKVYKEDELVYTGTTSKYSSTHLEPGFVYSYRIEVLDDNENIIDVLKIQTSTDKQNKNKKDLNDLIVTTVIKETSISMDWEDIDGVDSYEIYKNDNLLTTVNKSNFEDNVINVESINTYRIKGKRLMDKQRLKELEDSLKKNKEKKFKDKDKLYYDDIEIVKEISEVKNHLEKNKFQILAGTTNWDLRYTTFLADQWVANPNTFSKYAWFSGDNRGFSVYSSSYRTRVDLGICFCYSGRSVSLSKDVGATHGYDSNKNHLKTDTASSSGITLSNVVTTNSSKISFQLNHAVGNPLVASLDVDYTVKGEFYSNGNYKLSGDHDQAPHHEVYMEKNNTTLYQTMHQDESRGLEWLAPPMANTYWTKSNF